MRSVTIATLFHYADQADPAWRQRYDDEERQRAFARMAAGAGASSGAGTSGAGAGTGSTSSGTAGTGQTPPPLIQAKPFVLRDPRTLPRRDWVYGRHLIRKFGSATFAPSGSGKTNTFIVEALAMATGRDVARRHAAPPCPGMVVERRRPL